MKVLFCWPHGHDISVSLPLPYAHLVSQIDRTQHELRLIDYSLIKPDEHANHLATETTDFLPELIFISCSTHLLENCLQMADLCKKHWPNTPILWGGPHPTLEYSSLLSYSCVDLIFRGEAEKAISQILATTLCEIEKEQIAGLCFKDSSGTWKISSIERLSNNDLEQLAFPDFDFIRLKQYWTKGYAPYTNVRKNIPLWITRGCEHHCHFCSIPALSGGTVRTPSVAYVLSLIVFLSHKYNVTYFNIFDDNFLHDLSYSQELLRGISQLKLSLRFSTPRGLRIDKLDNKTLSLLKDAGWDLICLAQESGSQKVLNQMKKGLDVSLVKEKIKLARRYNFRIVTFFILGHPGETIHDLKQSFKLIRSLSPDFFHCFYFQPLAGTVSRKELINSNKITSDFKNHKFSEGHFFNQNSLLSPRRIMFYVLREYIILVLFHPYRTINHLRKSFSSKWLFQKLLLNIINTCRK